MATLPTFPTFVSGDSSLTKLQELAYAVNFLVASNIGSPNVTTPRYSAVKNTNVSVTSGSWVTMGTGTVLFDNDGQSTGSGHFTVTIVTQGIYAFGTAVDWLSAGNCELQTCLLWTAGSSNANYSSGTTRRFGLRQENGITSSDTDTVHCVDVICPVTLYPGDTVSMQMQCSTTTSTTYLKNTNYLQSRFVTMMTDRWVSYAT